MFVHLIFINITFSVNFVLLELKPDGNGWLLIHDDYLVHDISKGGRCNGSAANIFTHSDSDWVLPKTKFYGRRQVNGVVYSFL